MVNLGDKSRAERGLAYIIAPAVILIRGKRISRGTLSIRIGKNQRRKSAAVCCGRCDFRVCLAEPCNEWAVIDQLDSSQLSAQSSRERAALAASKHHWLDHRGVHF